MTDGAQLTIDQAVDWLMKQLTVEYKRECLRYWREIFGNQYADSVKAKYLEMVKK